MWFDYWMPEPGPGRMGCHNRNTFRLHYQSDRVNGVRTPILEIRLSADTVPPRSANFLVHSCCWKEIKESLAPSPDLTYTFTWDKTDVYNRIIEGSVPISVSIDYAYQAVYQSPAQIEQSFGRRVE